MEEDKGLAKPTLYPVNPEILSKKTIVGEADQNAELN